MLLVLVAGGIRPVHPRPELHHDRSQPDNVPIVAMIFLLGIFTWIALQPGVSRTTARSPSGRPPIEKTESDEKLFTWPDLVYTEMLCMILRRRS